MTPSKLDDFRKASAELNDELQTTPREAADMAARYAALKQADYLIPSTGERMTPKEYDAEVAALNKMLKEFVEREGAFHVEGVGTLRIQERSAELIDLPVLHQGDPLNFFRLLELQDLRVDTASLDRHRRAGLIALPEGPRISTSQALVIEKENR